MKLVPCWYVGKRDAVALGYFAYDFNKINRALPTTPAMATGITAKLWKLADLVSAWGAWGREQEERAA